MITIPFVLAVLGSFGGSARNPEARRFHTIDRDGFDRIMGSLAVRFEDTVPAPTDATSAKGLPVSLELASIDDFHPDRIAARLPALAELMGLRTTPPDRVALAKLGVTLPPADPIPSPSTSPEPAGSASGSLLDMILGASSATPAPGQPSPSPALEQFVRTVAAPALDRTDHALGAAWRSAIDRLVELHIRGILSHPRFRALETAWRGLYDLVCNVETGPDLVIRMVDCPKEDLSRLVHGTTAFEDSWIAELLCSETETAGGAPYAAILADHTFGPGSDDLAILEGMATIAARAGAPFIAAATPAVLGIDDFVALSDPSVRQRIGMGGALHTWRKFRQSGHAQHVALCVPRVLLRLPYGPQADPVGSFPFDEALSFEDHEGFLWGSPALAFGRVLAAAFRRDGWNLQVADDPTLSGLPLHTFHDGIEQRVVPCAEVVMSDATINRIAEEGLISLATFRDSDEARCYGIQTLAGTALVVSPR